jgi:hypothetical protein
MLVSDYLRTFAEKNSTAATKKPSMGLGSWYDILILLEEQELATRSRERIDGQGPEERLEGEDQSLGVGKDRWPRTRG